MPESKPYLALPPMAPKMPSEVAIKRAARALVDEAQAKLLSRADYNRLVHRRSLHWLRRNQIPLLVKIATLLDTAGSDDSERVKLALKFLDKMLPDAVSTTPKQGGGQQTTIVFEGLQRGPAAIDVTPEPPEAA